MTILAELQFRIKELETQLLILSKENEELHGKLSDARKLIDDVIETCNSILDELKS